MLYRLIDLLCGAIVPLLVVLLVFGLRKKAGARKTVLVMLFVLYLAEVADIVGIMSYPYWKWNPIVLFVPFQDLLTNGVSFSILFQYVANALLFAPFGLLLPMIWKRFRRLPATVLAGALTSLCIELLQLFSFRVTAADDLLMNTLGALLGYGIYLVLAKKCLKKDVAAGTDGRRDAAEFLLAAGAVLLSTVTVKFLISGLVYGLPVFPK